MAEQIKFLSHADSIYLADKMDYEDKGGDHGFLSHADSIYLADGLTLQPWSEQLPSFYPTLIRSTSPTATTVNITLISAYKADFAHLDLGLAERQVGNEGGLSNRFVFRQFSSPSGSPMGAFRQLFDSCQDRRAIFVMHTIFPGLIWFLRT